MEYESYNPFDFANRRHIGPSPDEMTDMLKEIGVDDLEQLISETIPADLRQKEALDWGPPLSERDALFQLRDMAQRNTVLTSLIGQGYYGTTTPPAIQRNILENPAWYTAYTPYQPEISQGRLEALLNFQTMVSDLTGLPIANASLLDEATAVAEAMTMARRVSKSKTMVFFVDENCHPQTRAVLRTRARPLEIEILEGPPEAAADQPVFGAVFQYPGTTGHIQDFTSIIEKLHAQSAVAIMAADILALTLLKPPGEMGADIAVGSTQRFGVPMGYGGPHAAYLSAREIYKRSLPGRIVGVSVDARGNRAYRLALQTREQHIRREKANSNICTAQALPAVMAAMYAVFHGPAGLRAIAESVHRKTARLAKGLEDLGFTIAPDHFFDTIVLDVGALQGVIFNAGLKEGVIFRRIGDHQLALSLDEQTRPETIEAVWRAFGGTMKDDSQRHRLSRLPENLLRTSPFLDHPIFHMNRAEAEMTRYMRRLADRDLALDRSMIPLGSCTMKLNATVEMMPISWPEFANLHPFAPTEHTVGSRQMIEDLNDKLCQITGYDAVSMQPNSGAQGEYAGLLTIRAYHQARGEGHRDICLIPASAHGTNPASAQMAGLRVIGVGARENGDIDVDDFREKAEKYGDQLCAAMITYPSTHGVFEETVREVSDITHQYGGQIYIDGANMNAMVGLVQPGKIGGDVSHLNLHKTFCIPHGGGGPGMGPIAVKKHLAPFLPKHEFETKDETDIGCGAVAAAPYGSPLILPVSWSYCLLMGGEGLTQASRIAILSANYIATRLAGAYPILYTSASGRVAHECIIDTRPLQEKAGISVDDIAKRLIDCGFHAPTMSWPVAGTLMIEPTESEPKAELDRFCEAMLAIRAEAEAIISGKIDPENNPLKRAPHTVEDLVGDWDRPYSRDEACFPPGAFRVDKYWPPVNRIDNAYGDRNLVCTCPSVEELSEEELAA